MWLQCTTFVFAVSNIQLSTQTQSICLVSGNNSNDDDASLQHTSFLPFSPSGAVSDALRIYYTRLPCDLRLLQAAVFVPSQLHVYQPRIQAVWEERDGLVSTTCACAIIPRKTWESIYVWKLSVKSIRIRPIYFRIMERYSRLPVELPSTPLMQRIIAVSTKPKMLSFFCSLCLHCTLPAQIFLSKNVLQEQKIMMLQLRSQNLCLQAAFHIIMALSTLEVGYNVWLMSYVFYVFFFNHVVWK